jgi:outer membrane protein W
MKTLIIAAALFLVTMNIFSQNIDSNKNNKFKLKQKKEVENVWAANLSFSDNGFGFGATKFFKLSKNTSLSTGIMFSGAKDDREFDQTDVFGNSVTPYKVNRLFMMPMINIGMQVRLFRDDVTDDMRPFINFGVTPVAIVYTPYNESFFSSFKYAKAKYTVGGYAGIGVDYITTRSTGLSFNLRYYYLNLFGEGINSISTAEIKQFGGIYFMFSYNFVK